MNDDNDDDADEWGDDDVEYINDEDDLVSDSIIRRINKT